jgi:hypothetical protein
MAVLERLCSCGMERRHGRDIRIIDVKQRGLDEYGMR